MSAVLESTLNETDEQLEALTQSLADQKQVTATLRNTIETTVRNNGIKQAFDSVESDSSQMRAVQAVAKDTVLSGGKWMPVVKLDGNNPPEFRHSKTGAVLTKADGTFGFSDWLVHLSKHEGLPILAKRSSSTANASPATNGGTTSNRTTKSGMSASEKRAYKNRYSIDAYNRLPYA